mmetsp:Transcript_16416/g.31383  ORF Transcript_16416/g.31383 Transcript_16416/m.31383 type:complete len:313 (-) Transcript_16416:142-1080(-)
MSPSSRSSPSLMVSRSPEWSHVRVLSAMIMAAVILSTTPKPATSTSTIFSEAFSFSRKYHPKSIIGTAATATTAASRIIYRQGENSRNYEYSRFSSLSSSSSDKEETLSDASSVPHPNPQTPEQTIQNQLHHFQRRDLRSAYAYASPANKRATGPFSQFVEMVNTPPYDLILGCERFDVLLEVLPDGDSGEEGRGAGALERRDDGRDGDPMKVKAKTSCCLVCIRPGRHARKRFPVWFWWEVCKVGDIDDNNDDDLDDEEYEDGDGDDFLLDDYDSRSRRQSQQQQQQSQRRKPQPHLHKTTIILHLSCQLL